VVQPAVDQDLAGVLRSGRGTGRFVVVGHMNLLGNAGDGDLASRRLRVRPRAGPPEWPMVAELAPEGTAGALARTHEEQRDSVCSRSGSAGTRG